MFTTFSKHVRNHKRKIAWSAPIIFLLLINSSDTLHAGNTFTFEKTTSTFLSVGDNAEIAVLMHTKAPVNAVGGTITMTPGIVRMSALSRITSVIDLWTEEPLYSEKDNKLHFSGGMLGAKAETPTNGTVFVMTLAGEAPGIATITMTEGQMLAANDPWSRRLDRLELAPNLRRRVELHVPGIEVAWPAVIEDKDARFHARGAGTGFRRPKKCR